MFNYETEVTFESSLIPGVQYRLRKTSHGRRMKLNELTAEVQSEIDGIQRELSPVLDDIKKSEEAARLEPCSCKHPVDPDPTADTHDSKTLRCSVPNCSCRMPQPDEKLGGYAKKLELEQKIYEIFAEKLCPIYIRWGLSSITGLQINGSDPTVDSFLSEMPSEVIEELGWEIRKRTSLSTQELLGFKSPTTSGALVDGPMSDTTAPPVSGKSGTVSAAAASTTHPS